MRKIIILLAFIGLVISIFLGYLTTKVYEPSLLDKLREQYSEKEIKSVDHSKFPILKKKFKSPEAVTRACIRCHNKRAGEIMLSNHWNWEREEYIEGRGIVSIGKKNIMNNFCIGTQGNEKSCAKCHIGYGMTDEEFSFTNKNYVDCLVCHDNTETYAKASNRGGAPSANLDFNKIAAGVGKPQRTNCGVCHFYGGGGNNVKHGDLEMAMFYPSKSIDIHMGVEGMDLLCVDCHKTKHHNIAGKMYSLSSMNTNRVFCEDCHTETPHEKDILNTHTLKVACQTCHIPVYAKENATKMSWDWSTAGRLKDGKPFSEEDSLGNHSYLSIKGSFVWEKNVTPEYAWFNGTASHYLEGDVIEDTTKPVVLNQIHGDYLDHESKIIPVKIHRSYQPFDPVNKILIQPKLFADKKGEGAFWKDFNWSTASKEGMNDAGLPFSGEISFIHTEMYWPLNHMVSSKEESLQCNDCHTRENSRLANLTDFYMPGRDRSELVDWWGSVLLVLSLAGVLAHGIVRIVFVRLSKKKV